MAIPQPTYRNPCLVSKDGSVEGPLGNLFRALCAAVDGATTITVDLTALTARVAALEAAEGAFNGYGINGIEVLGDSTSGLQIRWDGTTDNTPEGLTNLYFTDLRAQTAVVVQTITNADTTHAPSGDAVFDALVSTLAAAASDATTKANAAQAASQPLDTQLTSLAGLAYTGNTLKVVRVNAGETGFELATVGGSLADGDYGDVTVGSSGTTMTVDNNAVTFAKLQDVSATSRILGRKTASAGDAEECTLSEVLDFIGSAAQGDILYRGASAWARLAAGTSGQFLKTLGTGANPAWDTVSGAVPSGGVLGSNFVTSTTIASTTSTGIPLDNTIPQSGEGVAYTALDLPYTPTAATSTLLVFYCFPWVSADTAGTYLAMSICRDAAASAVFTVLHVISHGNGASCIMFAFKVPANAAALTTFKPRWSVSANTGYLLRNGPSGQLFGGSNIGIAGVLEIKA